MSIFHQWVQYKLILWKCSLDAKVKTWPRSILKLSVEFQTKWTSKIFDHILHLSLGWNLHRPIFQLYDEVEGIFLEMYQNAWVQTWPRSMLKLSVEFSTEYTSTIFDHILHFSLEWNPQKPIFECIAKIDYRFFQV